MITPFLGDQVVVVVGGAGLLGRAFCRAVGNAGAIVVVADKTMDGARMVAEQLVASGLLALSTSLDIGDKESIDNLINDIDQKFGRIDAVVNAAYPRNPRFGRLLEDVSYADFCENMSLHVGGYFLVAQRFAIYFQSHGGGNIINISSIYGSMVPRFEIYENTGMTMPVEYAGIKSAINHISRYFARYYRNVGIRCNTLSPGGIYDDQPAPFVERYKLHTGKTGMLSATDCTGTLLYLLSEHARHVTGQDFVIDDGFSL